LTLILITIVEDKKSNTPPCFWCVYIYLYREALQENEEGSLQPGIDDMIHKAKRRKLLEKISNVRLGMVRSVVPYKMLYLIKKNT